MSVEAPLAPPDIAQVRGGPGAQATIAFLLRLRSRGIGDLSVLRALETVPRDIFVPHRYADLALRDVALPIGCGQTMPEPFLVARATEALALSPRHRVLEIGSGSGYGTAILSQLAGEVLSLERYQTLAIEARARLIELRIVNAAVVWGDGLAMPAEAGLFDRIILHGSVEEVPTCLLAALAVGGLMIFARAGQGSRPTLMRLSDNGQGGFDEKPIGACRLPRLVPGLAREL
jgi:protein-L-isoaspartate(D-aspartate) O-methyltransferase